MANMEAFLNSAKADFPPHLNQELFEKAIRNFEKDPNAKVDEFKVELGSKLGDNFGSHVYRAKIKFTSKNRKGYVPTEISVIIKTLGENMGQSIPGVERDKYEALFKIEIEMYEKVLPEISALLHEEFWPSLVYIDKDLPVIMLTDVKPKGFNVLIEKQIQDFETSKMIVRKLAKFHAASFYLQSEHKCDFSNFNQTYHTDDMVGEMLVGNSLGGILAAISEDEEYKNFLPALKNFRQNYKKMTLDSYKVKEGPFAFNVLNHADFHNKNVLFKGLQDGKIEDVCVFDYQICYYGTPAIDLSHALYFFLSDENREKCRDEFIAAYHAQFVESLKSFGYIKPIPSLLDLQVELYRNGNLQAMIALCYSIAFYFDIKTIKPEDMADPVGLQKRIYGGETYQKMLKKELPRFVYGGMI